MNKQALDQNNYVSATTKFKIKQRKEGLFLVLVQRFKPREERQREENQIMSCGLMDFMQVTYKNLKKLPESPDPRTARPLCKREWGGILDFFIKLVSGFFSIL